MDSKADIDDVRHHKLLSFTEAATLHGVDIKTVYRWASMSNAKGFPIKVRNSGARRISKERLEAWLCMGDSKQEPENKNLIRGKEAAQILGVSASWLRSMVADGKLPEEMYRYTPGGTRWYYKDKLESYASKLDAEMKAARKAERSMANG